MQRVQEVEGIRNFSFLRFNHCFGRRVNATARKIDLIRELKTLLA